MVKNNDRSSKQEVEKDGKKEQHAQQEEHAASPCDLDRAGAEAERRVADDERARSRLLQAKVEKEQQEIEAAKGRAAHAVERAEKLDQLKPLPSAGDQQKTGASETSGAGKTGSHKEGLSEARENQSADEKNSGKEKNENEGGEPQGESVQPRGAKEHNVQEKKRTGRKGRTRRSAEKRGERNGGEEAPSVSENLEKFSADPDHGLAEQEAQKRLEEHGPNEIKGRKKSTITLLLSHFWGPIPWMLEIAIALSLVVMHWEEMIVISIMLIINGGLGFWHENQAQQAIDALKKRLAPRASVIRDGQQKDIKARNLVAGDIVILRMGDVVPADVQLLRGQQISLDESALTGESLPVDKKGGDICYSSTSIKRGGAKGVVTATGNDTHFARTVQLVESADVGSHFEKAVIRIGYFLIGMSGALVIAVVIGSFMRGEAWYAILSRAVVVLISGIPSALPAVLTVSMALGASHLARMKAIVSHLTAMEELAGLEVLCADKTGTLTRNQLTLEDPVVLTAENEDDLVIAAALTVDRNGDDPIDRAILADLADENELNDYEIVEFKPFDPTRKRAEAKVRHESGTFEVAKGAPQVILDLVEADDEQRKRIDETVNELGSKGLRALGVARKRDGKWQYLGVLPLLDPPREDTAEVVQAAKDHGIDVRMVTGDHVAIAKNIAEQVGLGQNILEAKSAFGDDSGGNGIRAEVLRADGFAEVTPEHKFNIIKAFRTAGRFVGMTGDGVNDAPALKEANVGIAVSGATDAARAAADLVLTQPGLGVITQAIEEARRIFNRMLSYATFRITATIQVIIFVTVATLWRGDLPVTGIMVALLAILNDIPIMTIATDNTSTPPEPVHWNMPRVLTISGMISVSAVALTFLLYEVLLNWTSFSRDTIGTMMFLNLLVGGHFIIYVTRNEGWFWQRPWPSWKLLVALESTQVLGSVFFCVFGVMMQSISWTHMLEIWGYSLGELFVVNAAKVATYRWVVGYSQGGRQAVQEIRQVGQQT